MYRALRIPCGVLAMVAAAACSDPTSATDLHPEGPPMIEQVRFTEVYSVAGVQASRTVFGFGTHPLASDDQQHAVTTAQAKTNKFRIIMDELLRGNNLEELGCRAVIDDDDFDRVPLGATPDDVARCSVPRDVLPSRCPASNPLSLCICKLDGGCKIGTHPDGSDDLVPLGESVGILDADQDGAADERQFIRGAVGITCNGIDVPIDLVASYWTPSGDQQPPAQGGFDALGPAIVLVPGSPTHLGALPTSLTCGLTFSPEVVDKDGNQVCAPDNGDLASDCSPGDTSAFRFTVEPLVFTNTLRVTDGQSRTKDILIDANAPLDVASVATITVTEGQDTSYADFTATRNTPQEITIHWTAPGGLAAGTRYTITVPTTVVDSYQQPPIQPFQIAFTTSAN